MNGHHQPLSNRSPTDTEATINDNTLSNPQLLTQLEQETDEIELDETSAENPERSLDGANYHHNDLEAAQAQ